MRHCYINDNVQGDHYGVSHNSNKEILIQLQEDGSQARISLSIEQAKHLIELLEENIRKIKSHS